jgi:hypothetical protein
MILSDEKYVLLCVDNPMSAHFLLFFFQALPSSITAKERSFSRIDIDCPLEERLGQVESTTSVLQVKRGPHFRHHIIHTAVFEHSPLRRAGTLGVAILYDLALGCGIVEIVYTSLEDARAAASSATMGNVDAERSARLGA